MQQSWCVATLLQACVQVLVHGSQLQCVQPTNGMFTCVCCVGLRRSSRSTTWTVCLVVYVRASLEARAVLVDALCDGTPESVTVAPLTVYHWRMRNSWPV